MSDRYLELLQTDLGRQISRRMGLPAPPKLRRADGGYRSAPLAGRRVLLAGSAGALLTTPLLAALHAMGATVDLPLAQLGGGPVEAAAAELGIAVRAEAPASAEPLDVVVFDASGIDGVSGLRSLYDVLQPRVQRLAESGRVLLVGQRPSADASPAAVAAFGALRGFMRSLAKEIGRKGATANLLETGPQSAPALEGALRFFLTEHSAFVSGQALAIDAPAAPLPNNPVLPLQGKKALVTGAARGIGAAIAEALAREGAQVIGVDRPADELPLKAEMSRMNGQVLALDVTAADAGARIREAAGALDIVVHNAGITRDKLLRNMSAQAWDAVMDVNLGAILRITEELLTVGLNDGARLVLLSSMSGIAGNAGQTNYAATKAALITLAERLAPELAGRGGAINAVAPGFIETRMTAQIPLLTREFGRRLSALGQGGLPADVAEAVTFLASPLACGINGRTLRVCGQHLAGA